MLCCPANTNNDRHDAKTVPTIFSYSGASPTQYALATCSHSVDCDKQATNLQSESTQNRPK